MCSSFDFSRCKYVCLSSISVEEFSSVLLELSTSFIIGKFIHDGEFYVYYVPFVDSE